MASWYEKSATWRRIVAVTKQSPAAMAAFTVVCFGVPYVMGKGVMWVFNPREEGALERQLRERATMDHKVLAPSYKPSTACSMKALSQLCRPLHLSLVCCW